MSNPTAEECLHHLRNALNHLYDPRILKQNALIDLLQLGDESNVALALQQKLIGAIEALEPEGDIPENSHLWRNYEILLYRYVQQWNQKEVADQLALSVRHLRREQRRALEMLAQTLLDEAMTEGDPKQAEEKKGRTEEEGENTTPVEEELSWLLRSPPEGPAQLSQVFSSVLELIRPLAREHDVKLHIPALPSLPALAIYRVALRQILLSLLSLAVHQSEGGRVSIVIEKSDKDVHLQLQAFAKPPSVYSKDETASLQAAKQVAQAYGGDMTLSFEENLFSAALTLPAASQLPVLVIDDNRDTLHLFKRYVRGTRYHIIEATGADEALSLADKTHPKVIVLDVMMPDLDGWELLGRLRQNPLTSHIPIVVCTILSEEELALSLGASGFVQKPVRQEEFLSALDQQMQVQASR